MDKRPTGSCENGHSWTRVREENLGEMDYSSYGGGVNPVIITLYVCEECGAMYKDYTGDFCGDPQEVLGKELEISDDDRYYAGIALERLQKERNRKGRFRRAMRKLMGVKEKN